MTQSIPIFATLEEVLHHLYEKQSRMTQDSKFSIFPHRPKETFIAASHEEKYVHHTHNVTSQNVLLYKNENTSFLCVFFFSPTYNLLTIKGLYCQY